MDSLVAVFLKKLREHRIVERQQSILVAVSGGVDSLALLHILSQTRNWLNIEVIAATFDHQLRQNSAIEVGQVKSIANEWGLLCLMGRDDVSSYARENHVGIEEAARICRYNFLANAARQVDTKIIVTAHHADDQAETILMHLVRGTGLAGLSGMREQSPVPGHPDLTLVRPLLRVTRSELEAYCQRWGLDAIEDPTNSDVSIARNYVRHEVMPHLLQLNAQAVQSINRLGELASADEDYLEDVYTRSVKQLMISNGDDLLHVSRQQFDALHLAMKRRLIRDVIGRLTGTQSVELHHVKHAIFLAQHGDIGQIAEFPNGNKMLVDYQDLWFGSSQKLDQRHDQHYMLLPVDSERIVPIPGQIVIDTWTLQLSRGESEIVAYIAQGVKSVLMRTRKPGDCFQPPGLNGNKQKLKKWLIDRKVPVSVRDRLPLLIVNNRIMAIILGNKIVVSQDFMVPHDDRALVSIFVKNP